MLTVGLEPEGITKTKMMYKAYLLSSQLKDYLAMILESGLTEKIDPSNYRTTTKGITMLETYSKMGALVTVPHD